MSDGEWYVAQDGDSRGPFTVADLRAQLAGGALTPEALVWGPEVSEWTPLKSVGSLASLLASRPGPPPPPQPGPVADEIDYVINGNEMQYVEVELDPGESVVAEAGAMLYMTPGVTLDTIFGDGRRSNQGKGGLLDGLLGAGKRLLTGESLFMTVFTNTAGQGKEKVGFAAPYPGKILPMDLGSLGGELICQKEAFLCAAKGVALEIAFQKKIGVGLFGGEGFIMQRLLGDGLAFVHAGGTVFEMQLTAGQTITFDSGCLVALMPSVDYDVKFAGDIKTAFFGGEGLFLATVSGPGHVWLQTLPFSRLARRMYAAAPQGGGKDRGEGSLLGGALGTFFGDK
ncbi:MAG: TIGR00266 family protein [Deltaproteobacteria bacterium]|nr:TIGR00266 family protein [Deltaproteobacteria bacterium]